MLQMLEISKCICTICTSTEYRHESSRHHLQKSTSCFAWNRQTERAQKRCGLKEGQLLKGYTKGALIPDIATTA